MKITESKLRQIIREELKTLRLYTELEGRARDLANQLTQKVHGPGANIDGERSRVDWKLVQKRPGQKGPEFTVTLRSGATLGKGETPEAALDDALVSPILVGRPFSE